MFEYTVYNRKGDFMCQKQIDLFEWARLSGFSYSSLESSKIWKIKNTEENIYDEEIEYESERKKKRSRTF
jgi:hypothetical protein